jgi:hypothetical protein
LAYEGDRLKLAFGSKSKEEISKITGDDAGLALLNDVVSAKEHYKYESSTESKGVNRKTGEKVTVKYDGTLTSAVRSFSITERGEGSAGLKPADDYQGYVGISPGTFTLKVLSSSGESYERNINRASVVFHELSESYERTTNQSPYMLKDGTGAHLKAIEREKQKDQYKNSSPGYPGGFKPKN